MKKISISVKKEMNDLLNEKKYNKSKLINHLLDNWLKSKKNIEITNLYIKYTLDYKVIVI